MKGVTVQQEKIFYAYLLNNPDNIRQTKPGFFGTKFIADVYRLGKDHFNKYNEFPSRIQIQEIIKLQDLNEEIGLDKLDILYNTNLENYDKKWVKEQFESWVEFTNFDQSLVNLLTYVKTADISTDNVKEVIAKAKTYLSSTDINFDFDEGLDFFNPDSHIQLLSDTFSTGFPFIDKYTDGGYSKKTLWVFMAPPKGGKSTFLGNLAAKSVHAGNNTAFISLEMKDKMCTKRIGSNMLNIPIDEYNVISRKPDVIKNKLHTLYRKTLQIPGKFHLKEFPTSSADVYDIERYLLYMEERHSIKYKTVFVDYINIIKNYRNPNTENTYMKIKQIAEDLRAMGQRNEWCIISATQTNRGAVDASDMSMSDISESYALSATVDVLIGIIQDMVLKINNELILKFILNRLGEQDAKKKYNIDYNYMRISENPEPEVLIQF